ncbi:hypothetical protein [Desulfoluna spongiiphila]|uniref:hypothetical protein n=1 Tax=Desulfoluna spongiiphila TaxID=419481 RepID=UPI001256FF4D|nr:hypothetical protein [Desulfoluna spongiiphila]VVS94669.1 hypothetical protein DBB_42410 [Desulfoluna spongiiphila]
MRNNSTLNTKRLFFALAFLGLIVSALCFHKEMQEPIKIIFESKIPRFLLWGYVVVSVVMHRFLFGSTDSNDSFIVRHFGKYADTVFAIGSFGLGGSTSIALMKGLYLQTFFEMHFFIGFGSFDLVSMFLLSSFLFVYCIVNTTKLFKEVILQNDASEAIAE